MIDVRSIFKNTSRGITTEPPSARGTLSWLSFQCNRKRYVDPEGSFTCSQDLVHYIFFGKQGWDDDHLAFDYVLLESEVSPFIFLKGEK